MITFRLVDTCLASSGARYDQPTLTSSSDELSSTTLAGKKTGSQLVFEQRDGEEEEVMAAW